MKLFKSGGKIVLDSLMQTFVYIQVQSLTHLIYNVIYIK